MAECVKFALFEKLLTSIRVYDLWNAEVGDQSDCFINDLFCGASLACLIDTFMVT